jgi:hypothetical protein
MKKTSFYSCLYDTIIYMKIKDAFKSVKTFQIVFSILAILIVPHFAAAEALHSPTWGFSLDVPEGYELSGGDGKNRFSFSSQIGAMFDIIVYDSKTYASLTETAEGVQQQLRSLGEISYFDYHGKDAALLEMSVDDPQNDLRGWIFIVELPDHKAYLAAIAYAPAETESLQSFHFSAIDSLIPTNADRNTPGPITEFSYPRGKAKKTLLAGGKHSAIIHEGDAEAAQALVDREFTVLSSYADSPLWQEAWIRFYRAIYRDSYERLADITFIVERSLFLERQAQDNPSHLNDANNEDRIFDEKRSFAEDVLAWVQSFSYERDLMGSDFVNLVSAAVEGRGDCDSRAMLWALILQRNNIPSAMMVSKDYSHAMGLTDIAGTGARFNLQDKNWIVAETTAIVPLGLIGKNVSDPQHWLGISFGL